MTTRETRITVFRLRRRHLLPLPVAALLLLLMATFMGDRAVAAVLPVVTSVSPSTGPVRGGTTITITGSGFLGPLNECAKNEAVYFGADPQFQYPIPATSFQFVSDTEVKAVTPAEYAGMVDVQVQNYCGTSSTSSGDAFAFSYGFDNQCLSGTCNLDVNANSEQGPITHAADGFVNGYATDYGQQTIPSNVPALIDALHPTSWKMGLQIIPSPPGALTLFQMAKNAGASITDLLETDWQNCYPYGTRPNSVCGSGNWTTPWDELANFNSYIQDDVAYREAAGTAPAYWEVWNEPCGTGDTACQSNTGTINDYLSVYQTAYNAIKAADPNAKVLGPGFGAPYGGPIQNGNVTGGALNFQTFLNFIGSDDLQFAGVTYHDEGEAPQPAQPDGPRANYTPNVLGSDVEDTRSLISQYTTWNPSVFVNEYGPLSTILIPGWLAGSFASLEGAGVDQANLTCGSDCTMMDGLFGSDGTPQMPYWVFLDYANMSDQRVATAASASNVSALATRNDGNQEVQVLLGRHDECGFGARANKSAGVPPNTCPAFATNDLANNDPIPVNVTVNEPYSLTNVSVAIQGLPNSATQPEGSNPVPQAPPSISLQLPVTNGTIAIPTTGSGNPLAAVGNGDAVYLTITPAS